ncbi:xylanase [Longimycelium tulufanense]|uniref:Xylanase n=1 Tax=Longimycelium tulufanense TaxID=907463 RepID=A0A8J3FV02_9PSEU|nr:xylanase [Longimycelium tulufanense]
MFAAVSALFLAGCGGGGEPVAVPPPAASAPSARPASDPAAARANELGAVPVLMYHRITTQPTSVYDRTPEDFRAELERLVREDYVPIRTRDYAEGRIDIPAGKHPVVLTFDDSTKSQLELGPDGRPKPDTAVAILQEVSRANPGFPAVASFYVNGEPFEDPGGRQTLRWLHENGFEIGNHTLTHANLGGLGPEAVQREIAGNQQAIQKAVPGLEVSTMALPFGVAPGRAELAREGMADGARYRHKGVLLVGSNPAPSPFAKEFDPLKIPRIRSQGTSGEDFRFGSTTWLDKLASGEVPRYTSDGDPHRISFPTTERSALAADHQQRARPY